MTELKGSRPREARLVHNTGLDVEGVFPFPEDLANRAVSYTHGGRSFVIIPETLQSGLVRATQYVRREVNHLLDSLNKEGSCSHCEGLCGPKEEDRPQGFRPTSFYITFGVDRSPPGEERRVDRPILETGVRCYKALIPDTPENRPFYTDAPVAKLPEGMQLDSRCYDLMGRVASASFVLFDVALQRLEAVDL